MNKVFFRSSWEEYANAFFDNNPNILRWNSEEVKIPYVKPTDGKVHFYYPDYWVEYKNKQGQVVQEVIEVKPADQYDPSRKRRMSRYDQLTYAINLCKWEAAAAYCKKRGVKFTILTEEQLFKR